MRRPYAKRCHEHHHPPPGFVLTNKSQFLPKRKSLTGFSSALVVQDPTRRNISACTLYTTLYTSKASYALSVRAIWNFWLAPRRAETTAVATHTNTHGTLWQSAINCCYTVSSSVQQTVAENVLVRSRCVAFEFCI